MYDHIIFDVDGTIMDTAKASLITLQQVLLEEFQRKVDIKDLHFGLGIPGKETFERLGIFDYDLGLKKWVSLMSSDEIKKIVHIFDGIEDILKWLKSNSKTLGIVTSRTKEELQVDSKSIIHYFNYIVCAEDTKKHKPNADPLLKYLELSLADPVSCLYIGDTIYDFKCAHSAGIDFALAGWGVDHNSFNSYSSCKHILDHPIDLKKVLQKKA